jgi:hypothetical protein
MLVVVDLWLTKVALDEDGDLLSLKPQRTSVC